MRRPRAPRWLVVAGSILALGPALAAAPGCEEPEPIEGTLLVGTIDTHHFCDMDAVVEVQLRAYWQACAEGEPGCEPPPRTQLEGDRATCPATDAARDLGVSLSHPGRYRIEAVAVLTTGEPRIECFVDPESGSTQIELTAERLRNASVVLEEHGACPP